MADKGSKPIHVPKDALNRVHLGHSFAEFDLVRDNPALIVATPAIHAASSASRTRDNRGQGQPGTVTYFSITSERKIGDCPPFR